MKKQSSVIKENYSGKNLVKINRGENKVYADNFPFLWKYTDLDHVPNLLLLMTIRVHQAIFITNQLVNPDEYW